MQSSPQERRQHPRGSGLLTQIEDVTYATLRNSAANADACDEDRTSPSSTED
jgi:hypothetical protein